MTKIGSIITIGTETLSYVLLAIAEDKGLAAPLLNNSSAVSNIAVTFEGQDFFIDLHSGAWRDIANCKVLGALNKDDVDSILRKNHRISSKAYYDFAHSGRSDFDVLQPVVPVSGRVFDNEELEELGEACLDFWLTAGRYDQMFTKNFKETLCLPHVLTVNSGSSANLLAVSALTSPTLGERRLLPGDEVLTVAAGFPTTISPIIQNGLVPVFVDIDSDTYNIDVNALESALSDKTKAIILAHTLGNPFDLAAVSSFAKKHNLWLIEDCCDALGAQFQKADGTYAPCGTFGDIATFSFYPAHHITMGEGGAVAVASKKLHRVLLSLRDWGRDCWCAPGADDSCNNRFNYQHGTLPFGYDHKYVYSHLGYNLKISDMQAAVGYAQLKRLPEFLQKREENFLLLTEILSSFSDFITLPKHCDGARPAWFGMPLKLTDKALECGSREDLLRFLNNKKIGTRLLFAGNMLRQPCMKGYVYRQVGELVNTDIVMNRVFWIGVFPGLSKEHLKYIGKAFDTYFYPDGVR